MTPEENFINCMDNITDLTVDDLMEIHSQLNADQELTLLPEFKTFVLKHSDVLLTENNPIMIEFTKRKNESR